MITCILYYLADKSCILIYHHLYEVDNFGCRRFNHSIRPFSCGYSGGRKLILALSGTRYSEHYGIIKYDALPSEPFSINDDTSQDIRISPNAGDLLRPAGASPNNVENDPMNVEKPGEIVAGNNNIQIDAADEQKTSYLQSRRPLTIWCMNDDIIAPTQFANHVDGNSDSDCSDSGISDNDCGDLNDEMDIDTDGHVHCNNKSANKYINKNFFQIRSINISRLNFIPFLQQCPEIM